jgi:hypothetical protein
MLFLQFWLIFQTNIQFQFALLRKMVYFSSSINTLKWYTLIHNLRNKHLLNFTYGKNTSGNIFDGKHVATMYRNTQNMVEPNFQLFIKYFLIFYTFICIAQKLFNWKKAYGFLHNEKTGNTFWVYFANSRVNKQFCSKSSQGTNSFHTILNLRISFNK